jgi:dienelactone hydrolase
MCAPSTRSLRCHALVSVVLVIAAGLAPAVACADVVDAPPVTKVNLAFDGHLLVGFLYKPPGDGPWPALLWNHGSEKNPGKGPQFATVASVFVPAGYVVFAPERRGHGESDGDYIVDQTKFTARMKGSDAANRLAVHLLETEQLRDQLAGLAFLQTLPYVDHERIVVAGCSFGGIEALLGAESRAGYKAAISVSPGGLSWARNDYLRSRLIQAVRRMEIPVLIIQPAHDASLGPSRTLGREAASAGTPVITKVYPATGPANEQKHCFGGASGMHVWADDAKAFLEAHLAH